jgi:hypothetical protein
MVLYTDPTTETNDYSDDADYSPAPQNYAPVPSASDYSAPSAPDAQPDPDTQQVINMFHGAPADKLIPIVDAMQRGTLPPPPPGVSILDYAKSLGFNDEDATRGKLVQQHNQANPNSPITADDIPNRSGLLSLPGSVLHGAYEGVVHGIPKFAAEVVRGGNVVQNDASMAGRIIARANQAEAAAPPFMGDSLNKTVYEGIKGAIPSMAVSVPADIVGSAIGRPLGALIGGAATSETGPGALGGAAAGAMAGGVIASGALTGTAFYRQAKDQFLSALLEKKTAENPNLTAAQWEQIRQDAEPDAEKVALGVALPMAAGTALTTGIAKGVGGKILSKIPGLSGAQAEASKILAKYGLQGTANFAGKMLTTTAEQEAMMGTTYALNSPIEQKYGMRNDPGSVSDFLQNQAGQVAVGAVGLGGAMHLAEAGMNYGKPKDLPGVNAPDSAQPKEFGTERDAQDNIIQPMNNAPLVDAQGNPIQHDPNVPSITLGDQSADSSKMIPGNQSAAPSKMVSGQPADDIPWGDEPRNSSTIPSSSPTNNQEILDSSPSAVATARLADVSRTVDDFAAKGIDENNKVALKPELKDAFDSSKQDQATLTDAIPQMQEQEAKQAQALAQERQAAEAQYPAQFAHARAVKELNETNRILDQQFPKDSGVSEFDLPQTARLQRDELLQKKQQLEAALPQLKARAMEEGRANQQAQQQTQQQQVSAAMDARRAQDNTVYNQNRDPKKVAKEIRQGLAAVNKERTALSKKKPQKQVARNQQAADFDALAERENALLHRAKVELGDNLHQFPDLAKRVPYGVNELADAWHDYAQATQENKGKAADMLRKRKMGMDDGLRTEVDRIAKAVKDGELHPNTAAMLEHRIRIGDLKGPVSWEAKNEPWTMTAEGQAIMGPDSNRYVQNNWKDGDNRLLGATTPDFGAKKLTATFGEKLIKGATVQLLHGANPTTVIHEMYHAFFFLAPKAIKERAAQHFLGMSWEEAKNNPHLVRQLHEQIAETGTHYYFNQHAETLPSAIAAWLKSMAIKFKQFVSNAAGLDGAPEQLRQWVKDVAEGNVAEHLAQYQREYAGQVKLLRRENMIQNVQPKTFAAFVQKYGGMRIEKDQFGRLRTGEYGDLCKLKKSKDGKLYLSPEMHRMGFRIFRPDQQGGLRMDELADHMAEDERWAHHFANAAHGERTDIAQELVHGIIDGKQMRQHNDLTGKTVQDSLDAQSEQEHEQQALEAGWTKDANGNWIEPPSANESQPHGYDASADEIPFQKEPNQRATQSDLFGGKSETRGGFEPRPGQQGDLFGMRGRGPEIANAALEERTKGKMQKEAEGQLTLFQKDSPKEQEPINRNQIDERHPLPRGIESYVHDKPEDVYNAIGKVYDAALHPQDNTRKGVAYEVVNKRDAELLKSETGIDLEGYVHVVDNYGIKHALSHHGETEEELRGQIPVSKDDFQKIPLVTHPENLVQIDRRDGKTVLIYKKEFDGTLYVAEEVREKRDHLALATLYKRGGGKKSSEGPPPRESLLADTATPTQNVRNDGRVPSLDSASIIDKQGSPLKENRTPENPHPDTMFQTAPDSATIDIDGVSRPTTNSKGQPIHPTEEGTRNFWKWFGDSKAVDEQGRPLVVYHGTNQPIDSFDAERLGASTSARSAREGFFFTSSPEQAGEYANLSSRNVVSDAKFREKKSAQLMRDMERAEKKGDWDTVERLTQELEHHELGAIREGAVGASVAPTYLTMSNPAVVEINGKASVGQVSEIIRNAKKAGNDGVILKGIEDSPETMSKADHYIVFDPKQIKSATGNRGTFDASNPHIMFQTDSPLLSEILNPDAAHELPQDDVEPTQTLGDKRFRIVGENPDRVYTTAQKAARLRNGGAVEVKSLRERATAFAKHMQQEFVRGVIDRFNPLKKLGKDVYIMAHHSDDGASALASTVGVRMPDGSIRGGKLRELDGVWAADTTGSWTEKVLQPLGKEAQDWAWWIAGNRAAELLAEKRERLFSDADIRAHQSLADGETDSDYTLRDGTITRKRSLIYPDALKTHLEFNSNILDMLEATGDIDPESRKQWEKDFFIPFYREQSSLNMEPFNGSMAKDGLVRQDAIKRLKGGNEKINANLLDNIVMNWFGLLDAGAKNRAAKMALDVAEKEGIAHRVEPGTTGSVWYMGYDEKGNHGKQYFTVDDPYIFQALTGLRDAGKNGPLMKAMRAFKYYMTTGVTVSPAFKIRNLIRDSVQSIAVAEMGANPLKNVKEGWNLTKDWNETLASMYAGGGIVTFGPRMEGNDSGRIHKLLPGVNAETIWDTPGKAANMFRKYIKPVMETYESIGNRGETVNRAALYKKLIDQGYGHAEASYMAKDLMNFHQHGAWETIQFLSQTVPFFNARLQGLYKLGKGAKENPARFCTVMGATALASIFLMAMYHDDDDWKKRTDADRNNYWWFKFGGTAFRIPKPFEIGAIATVAERGAEMFFDNEMTGKRFGQNVLSLLWDNLSMNPVPQMFRPGIDLYANKDGYSGAPIESMGMEKMTPEARYRPDTTMLARGVSKGLNAASGLIGKESLSPVQVDYLVKGYFAWLGTTCTFMSDMVVRPFMNEPSQPTPDYLKRYTAGFFSELPEGSDRYVSQMYDQLRTLGEAYTTYQDKVKRGDTSGASEYLASHRQELMKYKAAEKVSAGMSGINRRIRMIEAGGLPPDQKRTLISALKGQQDKLARSIQ